MTEEDMNKILSYDTITSMYELYYLFNIYINIDYII